MRIAILGNSGSGKSTLALWLANRAAVPLLDLDTVAWEPEQIAVARSTEAAINDVRQFCTSNTHWIVEGCYAQLTAATFAFGPRLLFLQPGEAQCIANCKARPWEPHKYASQEEQDQRLSLLLNWVSEYYTRSGDMSLSGHQACFDSYHGPKELLSNQPVLSPPSQQVLTWVE